MLPVLWVTSALNSSERYFQNIQILPGSGLIYDELRNVLKMYVYCIAAEHIDEEHSDFKKAEVLGK